MILLNKLDGNIIISPQEVSGSVKMAVNLIEGNVINNAARTSPIYKGPYEVTPSSEEQILLTEDRRLEHNIVVNPIPENYGLITWNGSYLRIS